jgi:Cu/Ag efflux protein CusF
MQSRRTLLCSLALLAACAKPKREPSFDYGEPKQKFAMRGKVLRLRPDNRIAVIEHEKIEGWMEAMTMEFPVPDAAQFAKLREDQTIRATVLVNDSYFWLADITPEP